MKNVYPVFFTKTDTVVLVEVPDLEILTEGTDMSDAIEMARDAIELKCVSMEGDGTEIPLPSEINDLDVNNGIFAEEGATVISFVDIDSGEYRRKIDTKTVRKMSQSLVGSIMKLNMLESMYQECCKKH